MGNLSIEQLIKVEYESLSKGKQKVARFVLESLREVSYSTITQLKKEIGVSETTVIRFAHALGFDSFSQMQKAIQQTILREQNEGAPQKVNENRTDVNDEYKDILQKDISILNDMKSKLDLESLNQASAIISRSQKILVLGHHTAYASAYWFSSTLSLMLPNVELVDRKNIYSELLSVNENTAALAISFPRYRKSTYHTLKKIQEKKGTIIAVSDSELSPIGRLAQVNLVTSTNRDESGYNSISPVISLLNLLIVNIRKKNQGRVKERLIELEKYYEEDDELFE